MEDRDEVESSVQKRGDGARQRVLTLAAELREEKALTVKLRAASEEGRAGAWCHQCSAMNTALCLMLQSHFSNRPSGGIFGIPNGTVVDGVPS